MKELGTHLEMAVEENLARGMSEREATRAAYRDCGAVSAVKEAHRQAASLYWLDTLLQDLRYARCPSWLTACHERGQDAGRPSPLS